MMKVCTHFRGPLPKDYRSQRLCWAFGLDINKEHHSQVCVLRLLGEANPKDRCGEYWSPLQGHS